MYSLFSARERSEICFLSINLNPDVKAPSDKCGGVKAQYCPLTNGSISGLRTKVKAQNYCQQSRSASKLGFSLIVCSGGIITLSSADEMRVDGFS